MNVGLNIQDSKTSIDRIGKIDFVLFCIVFVGLALPLVQGSKQSFWIDEGFAITVARMSTLGEIFKFFASANGSDPQMPGYYIYTHFWISAFGDSELSARASNLPWVVLLSFCWIRISKMLNTNKFEHILFSIVIAFMPYLSYFVYEFRPYFAFISCGALAYYGLMRRDRVGVAMTSMAVCIATALSLLGFFAIPAILVTEIILSKFDWRTIFRKWKIATLLVCPFLCALGFYYVQTIYRGAGGMRYPPTLINLGSIFYEFLGLLGLGPAREEFHDANLLQIFRPYASKLAFVIISFLGIFVSFIGQQIFTFKTVRSKHYNTENQLFLASFVFSISGIFTLFLIGIVAKWQVLARHNAMFFIAFIIPIVFLITKSLKGVYGRSCRAFSVAILMSWLTSSYRLNLSSNYERDDYRGAAIFAQQLNFKDNNLLFTGDPFTFQYYFSKFVPTLRVDDVKFLNNLDAELLKSKISSLELKPTFIFKHKPKYYDVKNSLKAYLAEDREALLVAKFKSFEIWKIKSGLRQ